MDEIEGNQEIEAALKEFEQKSAAEEAKREVPITIEKSKEIPRLTAWVMRYGGIERRPAEFVLLVFVLLFIFSSIFIFYKSLAHPVPPASEIIWIAGPKT